MTNHRRQPDRPDAELARLQRLVELLSKALLSDRDRALAQQKILDQHEKRLRLLEAQAKGLNEQN